MKRASYRNGIEFIALNDNPMDRDQEQIAGYISVVLMSELFGVPHAKVAADIVEVRNRVFDHTQRMLVVLSYRGLEQVKAAFAVLGITPNVQDRKHGGFDVTWQNGPSVDDIRKLSSLK